MLIQSTNTAGKPRRKPTQRREDRNAGEILRRVEAKRRRKVIVLASSIGVMLIAVIIIAIIFNSAHPEPGTLIVHIYDAALYQPPCPYLAQSALLPVNVTVTLNGPHSLTTLNVLRLVAYTAAPPGSYQVTATAAGYTQDSENATVTSGNTVHVCLALSKTG